MDFTSTTQKIKKAYLKNNLDLYKAADVWVSNNLSASDMIGLVQMDTGLVINTEELSHLIRHAYFHDINDADLQRELAVESMLDQNKVIPLTMSIKKAIKSVGNNTWTKKYGSSNIEWSIIFIDNKPHLARKQSNGNDKKFSKDLDTIEE